MRFHPLVAYAVCAVSLVVTAACEKKTSPVAVPVLDLGLVEPTLTDTGFAARVSLVEKMDRQFFQRAYQGNQVYRSFFARLKEDDEIWRWRDMKAIGSGMGFAIVREKEIVYALPILVH